MFVAAARAKCRHRVGPGLIGLGRSDRAAAIGDVAKTAGTDTCKIVRGRIPRSCLIGRRRARDRDRHPSAHQNGRGHGYPRCPDWQELRTSRPRRRATDNAPAHGGRRTRTSGQPRRPASRKGRDSGGGPRSPTTMKNEKRPVNAQPTAAESSRSAVRVSLLSQRRELTLRSRRASSACRRPLGLLPSTRHCSHLVLPASDVRGKTFDSAHRSRRHVVSPKSG
jgi:hypothetical protein